MGSTETARFADAGDGLYVFMDETLVVCPKCGKCAVSRRLAKGQQAGWFLPHRLTCSHCAYTKDWAKNRVVRARLDNRDDYFHLPLWLKAPCCGEVLWAYNERHLAYLEGYVGAALRERTRDAKRGWSNSSVASRLPAWMKSRKNRDEVMRGLERLRVLLKEA